MAETTGVDVQAFIAFGANMGDCRAVFIAARRRLCECGAEVVSSSSLYVTQAIGGPTGQPDYLNAVVAVETNLTAIELLKLCLRLEGEAGRQRVQHWGPRTLDLDLLLYGDKVCHTDALILPHPRLHQRRFVLEPLCEIGGDQRHPLLGDSCDGLLRKLPGDAGQPQVTLSKLTW